MNFFFRILTICIVSFGVGGFVYLAQADEQRTHRIIENPVSNGNVALRVNVGGVKTDALTVTGSTGAVKFKGTATNDNAATGEVGEFLEASTTAGITGSNDSGVFTDITGVSITLTPGDWDIYGYALISIGGTSGGSGRIHTLRLALSNGTLVRDWHGSTALAGSGSMAHGTQGSMRVSISATTTYKLRFSSINISTASAITSLLTDSGSVAYIQARRIR